MGMPGGRSFALNVSAGLDQEHEEEHVEAEQEGLDQPPKFAELANGNLYRVLPMKEALKALVAQKKMAQERLAAHPAIAHAAGKGKEVEVDGPTLAQSVAEAHKMGFTGHPEAVVYHPADGKPVMYKLESPQESGEMLSQVPSRTATNKKMIEVDSKTLAGSISRAHAMGLHGHPEAIIYHEANGKTEMYVDQEAAPHAQQLAQQREQELKKFEALNALGVDLSAYLCALATARPDQHLRIESAGMNPPAVHLDLPKLNGHAGGMARGA